MAKARMTKVEKAFYWKVWNILESGVSPSSLPGPMWQKWMNLQLNKTL